MRTWSSCLIGIFSIIMLGCNSTIVISKVLRDVDAHSASTNGFQQGIPSKENKWL